MRTNTIDTAMAKKLCLAEAIKGVSIIGSTEGWSIILKVGLHETPLGAQRSNKPRIWRSLDRCVEYVKKEFDITRFDLLDATNHIDVQPNRRADASERLKKTHQAAAYDKWFREEVEKGVQEADDPSTQWISNENAEKSWIIKRAKILGGRS